MDLHVQLHNAPETFQVYSNAQFIPRIGEGVDTSFGQDLVVIDVHYDYSRGVVTVTVTVKQDLR